MEHLTYKKRKNIGILINQVYGWYQTPICKGIKKVAKERDVNLLFFSGMSLKSKWKDEVQQNIIYQIVNTNKLDGLIVTAGVLSNFIGIDEFVKFIEPYRTIPTVSISAIIAGMPSVVFDNKSSMNLAMQHLITEHNYSNIAFISGPPSNTESILRYKAYIDSLNKYNISFDQNLIFEGDFGRDSGSVAVDTLFLERNLKPDAIVCANDEMAIGAYYRLKELGINIPNDVALVGFDDIESVRFFSPPFTSVRQPMFEMGAEALELLCNTLDGLNVPLVTSLKGRLMIRQSCGCMNLFSNNISNTNIVNRKIINYNSFNEACETFIKRFNSVIDIDNIINCLNISEFDTNNYKLNLENLSEALIKDVREKNNNNNFLNTLNSILEQSSSISKNYPLWKDIILNLRNYTLNISDDIEILYTVQNIFFMANDLIADVMPRNELFNAYNIDRIYLDINYITKIINSTTTLDDLIRVLKKEIKSFGLNQCYLCLYESPIKNINVQNTPDIMTKSYSLNTLTKFSSKIKLVLGYNNLTFADPQVFDIKEMLPDEYIFQSQRNEFVFLPLFVESDHFGYIVFDMNPVAEFILESLRENISNALKTHTLFKERQNAEEELRLAVEKLKLANKELKFLSTNDELTGLYNRRGFFKYAEKYCKLSLEKHENFTLFFGDLDGLKQINDIYGHNEGDSAICATAQILRKSFRNTDIISRLGGDEFLVIAKDTSDETLNLLQNNIDYNIEQYNLSSNKQYKLSLSIGFVVYSGETDVNFQDLIKLADDKLYEKKHIRKALKPIN